MTTYRITAQVPTAYQLQSIRAFGMEVNYSINKSHYASQDFDTLEEAKQYLIDRAEVYYDCDEDDLQNALFDIRTYGMLSMDSCTASIEEVVLEVEEDQDEEVEMSEEDRLEQDSIDRFEDDRQSNW